MSEPSYSELVAVVRGEGEALVAASKLGLDEKVPSCGDWTVHDLCLHVGAVYAHVARIIDERLTDSPGARREAPDGVEPVAWVAESLDHLVQSLGDCNADTPVWNWSPQPQVATFWARRMAHESAVHRFDAQRAHGVAQPIEGDVARDGFDELVDVVVPRVIDRDKPSLVAATYLFATVDEDDPWRIGVDAEGIHRLETLKNPDVSVRGTASALLLAAYGRVGWGSLDVTGDTALLDAWSTAFRF